MAIITLNCNLNGGDTVTPNNELFYRIYGDVDNYASPIHTTGTAIADANVTVDGDLVDISNVDGTTNTSVKISAVDEAGNEGVLSDAVAAINYLNRTTIGGGEYITVEVAPPTSPTTIDLFNDLDLEMTFNPEDTSSTTYLFEAGNVSNASVGLFQLRCDASSDLRITCTGISGADSLAQIASGAVSSGVDNIIEIRGTGTNIQLLVNGVDQLVDFTGLVNTTITVAEFGASGSLGTHFFGTKTDGTSSTKGDLKALRWNGEDAVFASDGISFPSEQYTVRGTSTMVAY